jgi:hypothetical protein
MTDPVDVHRPADNPTADLGYRSEHQRFVRAFVGNVRAGHYGERPRVRPLAVAGVIVATLAAGAAVGAIPRLVRGGGPASALSRGPGAPPAVAKPASSAPGPAAGRPARAGGTRPQQAPVPAIAAGGLPAAAPAPPAAPSPAPPGAPFPAAPAAPSPTGPAAARTPAAAAAPAAKQRARQFSPASTASFQAVTGDGCPQPADATSNVYGWYTQGDRGFFTVSAGSTTQSGCNGAFVAMPMSGSSATDDTQNLAIWTFRPPTAGDVCQVGIYIPDDTSIAHVGGNPSLYTVYDNGSVVGSFSIDQVAHLGEWVTGGTFPISSKVMTVQAHSRGQNWAGSTDTNAHIAVAAASATCRPA